MAVNQAIGGAGEPEQFRRRILSVFFSLRVFNFPLSGLPGASPPSPAGSWVGVFSAYGKGGLKTLLKN
jgi:hypothetical protein